ncbi:hypothetical protein OF897_21490, partial [Chryseobacterium formosus]
MKKYLAILILTMIVNCKAQSPIYILEQSPIDIPQNSYIKYTNNILNKFVGTWTHSENGKVFTLALQKVEMVFIVDYYKDLLKGKYKYINNGITIVDTSNFPLLNSKLTGAQLWEADSNKVTLFFDDPERPKMSCEVDLTYSNINGIEKLHWNLRLVGLPSSRDPNMNQATDFRVPT